MEEGNERRKWESGTLLLHFALYAYACACSVNTSWYCQHPRISICNAFSSASWYFASFFPSKSKICSQVIALAIGLFIKNLIVLLIRKVFMHFNLPSLTWEPFFLHSSSHHLLTVPHLAMKRAIASSGAFVKVDRTTRQERTEMDEKNRILKHSLFFISSMFTAVNFISQNFSG